jgi:hypothetical protein
VFVVDVADAVASGRRLLGFPFLSAEAGRFGRAGMVVRVVLYYCILHSLLIIFGCVMVVTSKRSPPIQQIDREPSKTNGRLTLLEYGNAYIFSWNTEIVSIFSKSCM